jgi:hypothetical protein
MKVCNTLMCDGDTCKSTDTWNDEWFKSVRAEVMACTSIYDGVTLLELDQCQTK